MLLCYKWKCCFSSTLFWSSLLWIMFAFVNPVKVTILLYERHIGSKCSVYLPVWNDWSIVQVSIVCQSWSISFVMFELRTMYTTIACHRFLSSVTHGFQHGIICSGHPFVILKDKEKQEHFVPAPGDDRVKTLPRNYGRESIHLINSFVWIHKFLSWIDPLILLLERHYQVNISTAF